MNEKRRRLPARMLYGVSSVYLGLAFWVAVAYGTYGTLPAALGVAGLLTLSAAIKNYQGGGVFLGGTLALMFCVGFGLTPLLDYSQRKEDTLFANLGLCIGFALLAACLFWFGHRRHVIKTRPNAAESDSDDSPPAGGRPMLVSSSKPRAEASLYPPTPVGRVFWLLFFSLGLYACFLMYRIVKDLTEVSETRLNPTRCAWMMMVPLYNLNVFYQVARRVSRVAGNQRFRFGAAPGTLLVLMIAGELFGWLAPGFLLPITVVIGAVPWLILQERMNQLRRSAGLPWCEEPDRYSWRQRAVLLAGLPFMVFALYLGRGELAFYTGERLRAEQVVAGVASNYRLTIPSGKWRRANSGSFPDTDMKLLTSAEDEWVLVRVRPSERQSLDYYVDRRQASIAGDWRDFKIEETRTLIWAGELQPMSLARYSQNSPFTFGAHELYVATLVARDQVIEVIGQGQKQSAADVGALVRSFRLATAGNES